MATPPNLTKEMEAEIHHTLEELRVVAELQPDIARSICRSIHKFTSTLLLKREDRLSRKRTQGQT
jgi:hypothetical protein